MSSIAAGTTTTTGYVVTSDTTGALVLKTGSSATTAVTIGSDQSVTFAGSQTFSGGTANGVLYLNGSKAATSGSALTYDGTNFAVGTQGEVRVYNTANTRYGRFVTTSDGTVLESFNGAGEPLILSAPQSSAYIGFKVNASEQMRLNTTGLGIGTSSPATKLDVYGVVRASTGASLYTSITSPATGGVSGKVISADNNLELTADSLSSGSTNLIFKTSASGTTSEKMRIDSSGNVGIGTSSPTQKLDVVLSNATAYSSGVTGNGLRLYNTSTTTGQYVGITFSGEPTAGNAGLATIMATTTGSGNMDLTFSTRGSSTLAERARIDSSGNLLVGTTSSSSQSGTFGQSIRGSNPGVTFIGTEASARIYTIYEGGGALSFFDGTAGSERARIDSSGNFMVGYSSAYNPTGGGTTKGTFGNDANSRTNLVVTNQTNNASAGAALVLGAYGADWIIENGAVLKNNTALTFSRGSTEAMRINSSAQLQVGLNNTGYTGQLQVRGLAATSGTNTYWPITISAGSVADTGGYTSMIGLGVEGNQWSKGAIGYTRTGAYDTGYIAFYLNATADTTTCTLANEKVRITNDGNVAIGNTSIPDTPKLGAQQTNATFPAFVGYCSSGSFTAQVIQARASRNTTNSTFKAFNYYNDGSNTDRFTVQDSGNVQNTNNSYGALSDVKLKENISDATPKLADLMQVRVRNYTLKSDPSHKQLGVVAQELESVFPSMVEDSTDTDAEGNNLGTKTKAVKYSVFVPMLIKAIQEQQAIIETLTQRITALEGTA